MKKGRWGNAAKKNAYPARDNKTSAGQKLGIVWFKWSDLRLTDHEPLLQAHTNCDRVIHLHVIEEKLLTGKSREGQLIRTSPHRKTFWRECVEDLQRRFTEKNNCLAVRFGDPVKEILAIINQQKDFNQVEIYTHDDFCIEEINITKKLQNNLPPNTKLQKYWGGLTVHHIDDIDINNLPQFKGEFNRMAKKKRIRPVLPIPKFKPTVECSSENLNIIFEKHDAMIKGMCLQEFYERKTFPDEFIKERNEFGVSCVDGTFMWKGGETAARQYFNNYFSLSPDNPPLLWDYRGATESFAHGDDVNPVFSGTRLSPWLAFGCISAREVVKRAQEVEKLHGKKGGGKSVGKGGSTGQRLHTELLFRDFLRFSSLVWGSALFTIHGPFGTKGVDWHSLKSNKDRENFKRWQLGTTGYPFIDAGMRQLRKTGYMSHLHRQCCAAFLARDLKLDWRLGAEHFEACLVDYTPDANWGNWAYRILQRPCLAESRNQTYYNPQELSKISNNKNRMRVVDLHMSTLECLVWPIVHDCKMDHTLFWVPELKPLKQYDRMREPWRLSEKVKMNKSNKVSIKPYKDSPLWFCAANRTNWNYEYFYLVGGAWLSDCPLTGTVPGTTYPLPMIPPLNVEVKLSRLPVKNYCWGDTPQDDRVHITP